MANIKRPKFSSITGSMAIVELSEPFERLEFQFMPGAADWDRQARNSSIQVAGRNNDISDIVGGADRLSFTITFYSEDNDKDDVKEKISWLQSLTFAPTKKVKVLWGDFMQDETWILQSVRTSFTKFMPQNGLKPQQASVDLVFELDSDQNRQWSDLR